MKDRVVVTGATSGLGFALAAQLGGLGRNVVVVGRDAETSDRAAAAIRKEAGSGVEAAWGNLLERGAVARLADQLIESGRPIDILVNNAGAAFPTYSETVDGVERTMAINHHAPFLLTELLRPVMSSGGLVVDVSSQTVDAVPFAASDPDVLGHSLGHSYSQLSAYGTSKLFRLLSVRSLASRSVGDIRPVLFDPGGIQSHFADKAGDPEFLRMTRQHWHRMSSPASVAADLVTLLAGPHLVGGGRYSKNGRMDLPLPAVQQDLCDLVYDRTRQALEGYLRPC